MKRRRAAAALLAALLLPGGCATPPPLNIAYHMAGTPAPVPGAASLTVSVVGTDGRTAHAGEVADPEGAVTIPVNNIPVTLAGGVERELKARGYHLGLSHAEAVVEVTDFHADFIPNFDPMPAASARDGTVMATAAVVVTVTNPAGAPLFARYYVAHAATPYYYFMPNQPEAGESLSVAMRRAVTAFVNDPAFQDALRAAQ